MTDLELEVFLVWGSFRHREVKGQQQGRQETRQTGRAASQGPDVLTKVISHQRLTPEEDLVDLCCLQVAILQLISQESLWAMHSFCRAEGVSWGAKLFLQNTRTLSAPFTLISSQVYNGVSQHLHGKGQHNRQSRSRYGNLPGLCFKLSQRSRKFAKMQNNATLSLLIFVWEG